MGWSEKRREDEGIRSYEEEIEFWEIFENATFTVKERWKHEIAQQKKMQL